MTELQIEELERNLFESDSYKEENRSANDTDSNLVEEVTDILKVLEADEKIGNIPFLLRKKRLPLLKK